MKRNQGKPGHAESFNGNHTSMSAPFFSIFARSIQSCIWSHTIIPELIELKSLNGPAAAAAKKSPFY